jgi:hypothetical protein
MYLLYPEGRSQVASLFADAWFHGFPERTLAGWGLLWRELASRLVRVQCDFSIDLLAVEGSLGTLADHLHVDEAPSREPVPDWLADRLICTAGMLREDVAALDLQETVGLWAEFPGESALETDIYGLKQSATAGNICGRTGTATVASVAPKCPAPLG